MVAFKVSYYENDGIPHVVYLENVYQVGDENLPELNHARTISASIIDNVLTRIQRYNGWSRQRGLHRVNGFISADNDGGNNSSFEEVARLGDLNDLAIMEIFKNIAQSNDKIGIYDLSWSFVIDPNCLISGAGGKFPVPGWAGIKQYRKTWDEHSFNGVKINCAAFAITYSISTKEQLKNINGVCKRALKLQQIMKWGEYVDSDELGKFVERYTKYKLCVLSPPNLKAVKRHLGNDYIYNGKQNIIYLYYYQNSKYNVRHYAIVDSPLRSLGRPGNLKWCWFCDTSFKVSVGHSCEIGCVEKHKKVVNYDKCEHCGLYEYPDHLCFHKKCKTCLKYYSVKEKDGFNHRCPLVFKEQKKSDEEKSILVYDFESRFDVVKSVKRVISEFKLDSNGYYIEGSPEEVAFYDFGINRHVANLVCVKDMNTGEKWSFFGDDCLEKFLGFCFSYNDGDCILLAHNSSGYDVRLLFEAAANFVDGSKMHAIMRGSKFMQLTIGKLVFRDVMLQIPGSLKNLAKDFGCEHQKGDFPFMFNKLENYGYIGEIPDISYFAIASVKNQKQYDELLKWHASWKDRKDWNFMEQLKSYCENDVDVLCEIVKSYHEVWVSKGIEPWLKPTGAGVVHQYMGIEAWKQVLDKFNPPENENSEEYYEWLQSITLKNWWAALKPYEHFFAHAALRGGRTEVKTPYFKLSDEDLKNGKKILYVDVCSMYPFQQIAHDFPVGTPKVYCWDDRYYPCHLHPNSFKCDCARFIKNSCNIEAFKMTRKPLIQDVLKWFGIVCVDLKPPKKMIHPVLVCWNEDMSKCVSTLRDEDHKEIIIGTASLKTCLENGYELENVYCFHEYQKGNFWREPTLKLYLEKMLNSKNAPEPEKRESMVKKWSDVYGEKFGDMMKESWPRWGKYSAKKFVAKIAINSVWGKHAQRVIMPKTFIYDFKHEREDIELFFKNCQHGRKLNNVQPITLGKVLYTATDDHAKPDLHNQYLPAALMVPEYGRLQLWNQMNKLGDRVLYCDTDSIVYVYDPKLYNVPIGDMVGDWEVEDICDNEIEEFVAWGPKTYAIKCKNGYTSVKAKGVCLKRSTEKLLNFEVMKQGALEFLETGKMKSSFIPQVNFVWSIKDSMRTIMNLKEACIKEKEIKGVLKNGYIYPFGYEFD